MIAKVIEYLTAVAKVSCIIPDITAIILTAQLMPEM